MIITGRTPCEQTCWSEPWTGFSARTGADVHVCGVWDVDQRRGVTTGSEIGPAVVGLFARTATRRRLVGPCRARTRREGHADKTGLHRLHVPVTRTCRSSAVVSREMAGTGCLRTLLPRPGMFGDSITGGSLNDTARWHANRTDRLVRVSSGDQGGAQRGKVTSAPCVGPEAGRSPALGGCPFDVMAFSSLRPEVRPSRRRAAPQGE
jgi:hypothetical protein